MKANSLKKGAMIGALFGLILFVIIGFLPSAYTGGLIGLKLIKFLLGAMVDFSTMSRILVALLMILSVIISGAIFIVGCAMIGWIITFLLAKRRLKENIS